MLQYACQIYIIIWIKNLNLEWTGTWITVCIYSLVQESKFEITIYIESTVYTQSKSKLQYGCTIQITIWIQNLDSNQRESESQSVFTAWIILDHKLDLEFIYS